MQEYVIYLERNPITFALEFPTNNNEIQDYQVGDLYITSNDAYPSDVYQARATFGESIIYCEMIRIKPLGPGLFLYRIIPPNGLYNPYPHIEFIAIRSLEQFSVETILWSLHETNTRTLDFLDRHYDFNIIGVTPNSFSN
jgi:hypothetical protein